MGRRLRFSRQSICEKPFLHAILCAAGQIERVLNMTERTRFEPKSKDKKLSS